MSFQTSQDIPLRIVSENASAERRITPSWTIAQLKVKLEPVTGIPPSAQKLTLKLPDQESVVIEAEDEESVQIARWPLRSYADIIVRHSCPVLSSPSTVLPFWSTFVQRRSIVIAKLDYSDNSPLLCYASIKLPASRLAQRFDTAVPQVADTRPPSARLQLPSLSSVPKYTMPESEYETRSDSVLAWKKANKLGRFDPHAADADAAKLAASERDIKERG